MPMTPDSSLVKTLVTRGNHDHADHLIKEAGLGIEETEALLETLGGAPPLGWRIFVPLPRLAPGVPGLVCDVELLPGESQNDVLGESARASMQAALADAWHLVGGSGEPPCLGLHLEPAASLGLEVDGPSLYLPVLLAAVSSFSGVPLHHSAMATGTFDEQISFVPEKSALLADVKAFLGIERLLVASSAEDTSCGPEVHWCRTPEQAVEQVFGFIPWHPDVEVRRVHLYCEDSRRKAPWQRPHITKQLCADEITPDDLDLAVAMIRELIDGHQRVEVSIGGPVILAAYLGHTFKNTPHHQILVVHGSPPRPWWHNHMQVENFVPGDRGRNSQFRRMLVCTGDFRRPGWESFSVPGRLDPVDLVREVARFAQDVRGAAGLDLAVKAHYPMAWALAQSVRNNVKTNFYHWTGAEYQRWFGNQPTTKESAEGGSGERSWKILSKISFIQLAVRMRAVRNCTLPRHPAGLLRSCFGAALRAVCCPSPTIKCKDCPAPIQDRCVYLYLFDTPRPSDATRLRGITDIPRPFALHCPPLSQTSLASNSSMSFSLTLVGRAMEHLPHVVVSLDRMGVSGLGGDRVPFVLDEIEQLTPEGSKVLIKEGRKKGEPEKQFGPPPLGLEGETVDVVFDTPTCITSEGRILDRVDFSSLVRALLRRVSALAFFHCGTALDAALDFGGLVDRADSVRLEDCDLRRVSGSRYSRRQKRRVPHQGVEGRVRFHGPALQEFSPLLSLGTVFGVGKKTTSGMGRYRVLTPTEQ